MSRSIILSFFQQAPYYLKVFLASIQGYKLKYRRRYKRSEYLREVIDRDNWSYEKIARWQEAELLNMLRHAAETVPYYRNYWRHNSEKDYLNLQNWPILEKSEVKSRSFDFISDLYDKKDLYPISTSGTSGTPMTYWFDREALSKWYAIYEHRIKRWNGVSESDRWANIGGQLICNINQKKPPFWVWNFAMKQLYLSSYHITEENIEHYLRALQQYKIVYLLGYVSSIFNLANIGIKKKLHIPKLKLVITNAEPLFDYQREIISKAFCCDVVQTYSGCEFAFGGNEDLSKTMYLWPEAGILEVEGSRDENQLSEQRGNFIATGLINKAMPLIRYRIGDSGIIDSVSKQKGRNFESLKEITGRNDDLIYTTEGKLVGRLDPVFKGDFQIKEAQIIQENLSLIKIKIVPFNNFTTEQSDEIIRRLKERVGMSMQVSIDLVDVIPKSANGKFKAVISYVKQNEIQA